MTPPPPEGFQKGGDEPAPAPEQARNNALNKLAYEQSGEPRTECPTCAGMNDLTQGQRIAELERVGRTTCVGDGTEGSGCGHVGGRSGFACPKCNGMLLSDKSNLEAKATALTWIGVAVEQRDNELAQLRATIETLTRERDAWKSSHDNQVKLRRALMDRPDLKERAKLVQELVRERDEARAEAKCCPNPLCGWIPQTYGEAVIGKWIKGDECINYEWDNRTTAENAKWLIELYRAQLAASEKDRERLDWLQDYLRKQPTFDGKYYWHEGGADTLRAAIDAAMKEAKTEEDVWIRKSKTTGNTAIG